MNEYNVKAQECLKYLQDNITEDMSMDEKIDVFKKMCEIPAEEPLLMYETGVFPFTKKPPFEITLTRQIPDGDGEYLQIKLVISYKANSENKQICEFDDADEDDSERFYEYIYNSASYKYAIGNKPLKTEFEVMET